MYSFICMYVFESLEICLKDKAEISHLYQIYVLLELDEIKGVLRNVLEVLYFEHVSTENSLCHTMLCVNTAKTQTTASAT